MQYGFGMRKKGGAIAPDNIQVPFATMGENAETPEIDAAIAWIELGNGEMMLVFASSFPTLRSPCFSD